MDTYVLEEIEMFKSRLQELPEWESIQDRYDAVVRQAIEDAAVNPVLHRPRIIQVLILHRLGFEHMRIAYLLHEASGTILKWKSTIAQVLGRGSISK